MRTGGGPVQQQLAPEVTAVVTQAVCLARRRGHRQVTPLHVASAMLSGAGLLRSACLQSHAHPLQCKELELCFNVALSRLPSAAAAMFHHAPPGLSNALVAALKRAQAYHRRGPHSEGQQPAAAVELGHLVVSMLDDPNVSRVLREAGFSSLLVRANVEKAISFEQSNKAGGDVASPNLKLQESGDAAMRVLDCMASGRRRCVAVVGESAEGVVKAVMDRVSKGELQRRHDGLRNLQLVPLLIASFQRKTRQEVEATAGDLRALVRDGCTAGKGVVLVVEDLSYAAEAWATSSTQKQNRRGGHCYCPVEHVVMEVSSLVREGRGGEKFWLLGFASDSSYSKCRAGQPPLEVLWEVHPMVVIVPDGGAAVSRGCDSEGKASRRARSRTARPTFVGVAAAGESELRCWGADGDMATTVSLSSWLRRYQDPVLATSASYETTLQLQDLCNSAQNGSEHNRSSRNSSELSLTAVSFSSTATASASPATSSTTNYYTNLSSWFPSDEPRIPWPELQHGDLAVHPDRQRLHANPYPIPGYSSSGCNSSDCAAETADGCRRTKFAELTAENLKVLCGALETRVPRHKGIVPDIASAVLQRRSGMARRPAGRLSSATWLVFEGRGRDGKKAIAQELAKLVFGSYTEFTSISLTDQLTPVNSACSCTEEPTHKRKRSPDNEHGCAQKLYQAVCDNPHRVVMIDSVDKLHWDMEIYIKSAIVEGRIRGPNGDVISLEDAIIVLTSSPQAKKKVVGEEEEEDDIVGKKVKSRLSLDLNAYAEETGQDQEDSWLHDVEIMDVVDGVFFFRPTDF